LSPHRHTQTGRVDKPLTRRDVERLLRELSIADQLDLSAQNLSGIDLTNFDLTKATLSGANLTRAILTRATLSGANLTRAILTRADLRETNLSEANLSEATLSRANLSRANLSRANLSRAILSTTVALSWRTTTLKPVREQNWFERSARRGVGLKRGGHLFQASDGQMHGLAQPVSVALPVDASIGHPTGPPLGA
jgi:hypothetical protein